MIDFETREFVVARISDAREFFTTHKTSLIELGTIVCVTTALAGGLVMFLPAAPASETSCAPDQSRFVNGAVDMPKPDSDRAWQWPITDEPASEETKVEEDEPTRRVRHHRRRG